MSKPDFIAKNPVANGIWNHLRRQLKEDRWHDRYEVQFAVLVDAVWRWALVSAQLSMIFSPARDKDGQGETSGAQGMILVNRKKGTIYRNPLLDVQAQQISTIKIYGTLFGLNPMADAKLALLVKGVDLPLFGGLTEAPTTDRFAAGPPGEDATKV
jgi:phage terminase small subunit